MNTKIIHVRAFVFYLFVVSIPVLNSCKKSKGNDVETVYVPAYLKQMLPYNDGQNISYINGAGNTVNATVQKTTYWSTVSACQGCPVTKKIEYYVYKFLVGTTTFVYISIDNRPNIFMSIFSPQDNYNIGGGFDFLVTEGVAQPVCSAPRQTCVSSVTLNGITYNNVLEIISGATQPNQLVKAYYTVAQGLIGFSYGSGVTYRLM